MIDESDKARILASVDRMLGALDRHELPARTAFMAAFYAEIVGELSGLSEDLLGLERLNPQVDLAQKTRTICSRLLSLPEFDEFTRSGGKINAEANQIIESANRMESNARAYGETLEGATARLGKAEDREQIQSIIHEVSQETGGLLDQNAGLMQQLRQSTQTVQVLQARLEEIQNLASKDAVTGLYNRRHFLTMLDDLLSRPANQDGQLCLIFIDIDNFKGFNDRYGHAVGDMVLKLVARILQGSVRAQDICARFGGDEFIVTLPGITLDEARPLAERLRARMAATPLRKRGSSQDFGQLTISMGMTGFQQPESAESLIERADTALLSAKKAGKNMLVVI
ncbi:GGDEF domain-containing protein [Magnetospira thiophila]